MVRISGNKIFIKILYWGSEASGKTTAMDTLYRLTTENALDIKPFGKLVKIQANDGSTMYFDRVVFESMKKGNISFQVFAVAGKKRFSSLRKETYKATDGIILVFDAQKKRWEANLEALRELKSIAGNDLVSKIPVVVMQNKMDLDGVIDTQDIQKILQHEGLWYPIGHVLHIWNPVILPTISTFDNEKNVYRAFGECAKLTGKMIYKSRR
ncbi:MAG: ADP-ribosylation factor-like protein [Candidatus Hodarchaeota archaeon]